LQNFAHVVDLDYIYMTEVLSEDKEFFFDAIVLVFE